ANRERTAVQFASCALLVTLGTYFCLNFAFFRFPWPWGVWTMRTPNALCFAVCTALLTAAALYYGRTAERDEDSAPPIQS
ncbi:MAG: hypothetical protein AAF961_15460, partial [Planctomycetota bacterium]